MAGRHRNTRGLWLRGEQRQGESAEDVADMDARLAEAVKLSPSWNDSTICIQTIRDVLTTRGWSKDEVPMIPMADSTDDALPRRSDDFRVGWWR